MKYPLCPYIRNRGYFIMKRHVFDQSSYTVPLRQSKTMNAWIIPFTDMMALMLTFFVMLFAMSTPEKQEWHDLTERVQENFSPFNGAVHERGAQDAINVQRINFAKALNLDYLHALFEKITEQEAALSLIQLHSSEDRLILSMPEDLLFDAGKANVKADADKALLMLANTISRIKNRVEVVGHTDPMPPNGAYGFVSNWELSLTRALNIAEILKNNGYSRPIITRGQSDGLYQDLPEQLTEKQRFAVSRRVDIIIMEDDARGYK